MNSLLEPKLIPFRDQVLICRMYDLEDDPEKIILSLYTKLTGIEGLTLLKKDDQEFLYNSTKNYRLVAELNNNLISSVVIHADKDFENTKRVELFSVVTSEKYRGTDVTKIMFSYCLDWIRKMGSKHAILWTDLDNYRAQGFYKKMGFVETSRKDEKIYFQLEIE